jgi:DNA polymerase-1
MHRWMQATRKQAIEQGYSESAFGRKRRFPIVLPSNKYEIERQAINAPVQSAASDVCLMALTRLHNRMDPKKMRILLTVHDSILFEVKKGFEHDTLKMIHEEMVDKAPLKAPFAFSIECKGGKSWGSLRKLT